MSYVEATVIVEGALDETRVFGEGDAEKLDDFEAEVEEAAKDGLATELYVLRHDHEPLTEGDEDCACAQYLTDHLPARSWNV